MAKQWPDNDACCEADAVALAELERESPGDRLLAAEVAAGRATHGGKRRVAEGRCTGVGGSKAMMLGRMNDVGGL